MLAHQKVTSIVVTGTAKCFRQLRPECWFLGTNLNTSSHLSPYPPCTRAPHTVCLAPSLPQVFHNFVFRRSNKRRNKEDPTGVSLTTSSSCSSLQERNRVAHGSRAIASWDDSAADLSPSAAGSRREGRWRVGRSGGSVGSSVRSRMSSSGRQRTWETPPAVESDR